MNEPIIHHYLPIFYLSKWIGPNQKLCRFSKPNSKVIVDENVSPKSTGFEPHLYNFGETSLEIEYTQRIDNDAANVLTQIEQKGIACLSDPSVRKAWSKYLTLQLLRVPLEVNQLKLSIKQEWHKSSQELQTKHGSNLFNVEQIDQAEKDLMAEVAKDLFSHRGIVNLLQDMHWGVIQINPLSPSLLTSDKPIWHTATLAEENAFLHLPIGPRLLFLCCKDKETYQRIKSFEPNQMSKKLNRITVAHAEKFVFGGDSSLLPFVSEHFGTRRHSGLFELVAKKRGLSILSERSPQYTRE
jgi:hypothetical protein